MKKLNKTSVVFLSSMVLALGLMASPTLASDDRGRDGDRDRFFRFDNDDKRFFKGAGFVGHRFDDDKRFFRRDFDDRKFFFRRDFDDDRFRKGVFFKGDRFFHHN